jgi:HlyD family secretion protein
MKKKNIKNIKQSKIYLKIKKYIPTIIIVLIVGGTSFFIGRQIGLNTDTSSTTTVINDVIVEKQTIKKTLTSSGEITSASTEKLSLSTTYYFDSLYVEEGDIVKSGEKILKYTNGKYLTAPYDLVITSISVPSSKKVATSSNYIEVEDMSNLIVKLNISESEISNISLDQEVEITLTADSSKTYTGKISKISAIGSYSSSGSTFPVEISIENDGDIKIGNSVSCTINIEELEDVIAVPIDAVQITDDRRYVVVVDGNTTKEVEVTTGLSDDEYVQIKSGLVGGETIRVVTVTKQSTIRSSTDDSSGFSMEGGSMPSGDNSFDGSMPSGGNSDGGMKENRGGGMERQG